MVKYSVEMVKVKASRDISKVVKGDKIKIDKKEYEVDAHYVMMEHSQNKEMIIEVFDPKSKKEGEGEGQLRYFNDQVESTMKFFEMKGIMYEEQEVKSVEW